MQIITAVIQLERLTLHTPHNWIKQTDYDKGEMITGSGSLLFKDLYLAFVSKVADPSI